MIPTSRQAQPIHNPAIGYPYGSDLHDSPRAEDGKSRLTAAVLALLLGGLGLHKFYLGAWGWGLVHLLLCWTFVPAVVAFVEGVRYLALSEARFRCKAARMNGPFAFLW
jgi:TM2 domain-containing membrane protein YozV